jgi:ribonuclease BN (tRNA processing enzyme)
LKSFEKHSLDKDLHYGKNGIEITAKEMVHPVESYALKFKSDKGCLVYSADTSYNADLVEFTRDCDALLADSAFLKTRQPENAPHMSAYECGMTARQANAGALILTHLNPEIPEGGYLKEASEVFKDTRTAYVDMEIEV